MNRFCRIAAALTVLCCLAACDKSPKPAASPNSAATSAIASSPDAALQKLQQDSGSGASDCGRLGVSATQDQLKGASDCAMEASKAKRPFYVAYDMPGMTVGVAGNSDAKLFTVQSHGAGSEDVNSDPCPSQLRIASSGRVTCFAPGDMGSMGSSHAGATMPAGTANPHTGGAMAPSHKP
ncbi:MAG: hypothetical protein WAN03_09615 [Candidatus Sulfotelmatobacter sp.]